MVLKSIIPNSLTSLNLFCGCLAALSFLNHFYYLGIIFVLISSIADFFDGFAARLLKVQSELGKELDSLADMISFGFVPGIILYTAFLKNSNFSSFNELIENQFYLPFSGFILTIFSGLRLAKFNIDTRQSTSFIGLPTPANTLFFLTIPLIWIYDKDNDFAINLISNNNLLLGFTLFFSYLLIAELPLIALKFQGLGFKNNFFRYILILFGIIALATLKHLSIPVILIFYLAISLTENIVIKKHLSK